VHKAQGSEADHVLLVLPRDRHPLLTRSLLYTGVTRARRSVTVVGSEDTIRAAVLAREQRRTALRDRLREDPGA
jgi:exodeoxyribonuclease V alpha subunit